MKLIIKRRGVFWSEAVEELPDLKGVKLTARLINKDDLNIQYILYFKNETYTVDLSLDDYEEFSGYLDEKFKAAGVKPKLVKGTIQYFWEENHADNSARNVP